jgi:ribosomal protein S18 acetylase RimI-like enzyme
VERERGWTRQGKTSEGRDSTAFETVRGRAKLFRVTSSSQASRSGVDRARIVCASERDLPAVAELAGVIWRRHYPGIISVEQIEYMLARGYSLAALRRFITEEGAGLDLAYLGERLTGFTAYYRPDDPRELKLDKLYIHHDFRGLGIGRSLIASAEAATIAQHRTTLILNVNKNNVQAIRAYERNGFSVREAMVVDIGGGFVMDDYVMAKQLSP